MSSRSRLNYVVLHYRYSNYRVWTPESISRARLQRIAAGFRIIAQQQAKKKKKNLRVSTRMEEGTRRAALTQTNSKSFTVRASPTATATAAAILSCVSLCHCAPQFHAVQRAGPHRSPPPSAQTKDEAQATLTTAPGEVATVEAQEGHVYVGSLKNGLRHGTGKMTRVNGATYEGEWHEGARHGTGRFSDGTGTVYEGQFQNDKRHGKGKIVWSDGRIYDGEWEDDQRHGHGNFTDAVGNVYDGGFVRDALEGHGITHRVDGGSYEGEFVDGDRQGYGQFTGKDGDGQFVYQGNYVANKRHGPVRSLRLPLPIPLCSCPS